MRILVVGSDSDTRQPVEDILRAANHTVDSASSAGDGIAALRRSLDGGPRLDLVVADGALPPGALRELVHESLANDAPWAIVLAGGPDEAAEALAAGAVEVVPRPVEREELLRCLGRLAPYLAVDAARRASTVDLPDSVQPERSLTGAVLDDRYEVLELIGEGGMGQVYKARHLLMNELLAVKVIRDSRAQREQSRARFLREVRTNLRVAHPNVVAVRDCGLTPEGKLYMAMDYSPGDCLRRLLRREGPLPEARVLRLARQCAEALRAAHAQGVVHRDLKPDNVLVEAGDVVRVCDFGLAKLFMDPGQPGITSDGLVVGTPEYMSPEQCEGREVDGRADLYALGCLIFECVTGAPLFPAGSGFALLEHHVHTEPPRPSSRGAHVSSHLEALLLRLLAKEPNDRPQTAAAVVEALGQLERAHHDARGPRALVADDSGAGRALVAGLLRRRGYQVTATGDGASALRLATSGGFDLVVLDGEMPSLDGADVALLIRANQGDGPRVPIILVSSTTDGARREEWLEVGVDVVLPKPLRPSELGAAVRDLVAAANPRAPEPAIDEAALRARVEGDADLRLAILEQFAADVPRFEATLRAAMDAKDTAALRAIAHELKGAAGNCAMRPLARAAARLEEAARSPRPLVQIVTRLLSALEEARIASTATARSGPSQAA